MAIAKKRTEHRKLRDCRVAGIKASQAEHRRSIVATERLVGESDKMLDAIGKDAMKGRRNVSPRSPMTKESLWRCIAIALDLET
jgi:hypothetical protein